MNPTLSFLCWTSLKKCLSLFLSLVWCNFCGLGSHHMTDESIMTPIFGNKILTYFTIYTLSNRMNTIQLCKPGVCLHPAYQVSKVQMCLDFRPKQTVLQVDLLQPTSMVLFTFYCPCDIDQQITVAVVVKILDQCYLKRIVHNLPFIWSR